MNVNISNQMVMNASIAGVSQQVTAPREIKKEMEQGTVVQELDRQGQSKELDKDITQLREFRQLLDVRQQAHGVGRRYVSEENQKASYFQKQGPEAAQQSYYQKPLGDTTQLIQQQFMARQRLLAAENSQSQNPARPEVQRKQFITNLRQWVSLEYSQYVKGDHNLYSRRNLREILAALSEHTTPQTKSTKDKEDRRGVGEVSRKYTRANLAKLSKIQAIFEEPQDQQRLLEDVVG